jgi:anti-anti-sigma factor
MGRTEGAVRARRDGEVTVVEVGGEIDLANADEVLVAMGGAATPVVVDLRGCSFMASDGLRALLQGRESAKARGHRVVLVLPDTGGLPSLFEAIGGATIFNIAPDLASAIGEAAAPDRRVQPDRRSS